MLLRSRLDALAPPRGRAPDPRAPALAGCALFLDVDGTVLDIAERPANVVVPRDLVETLRRLSRGLGGALALVSGRTIADLDGLFAPLILPAAGVHAAELRIGQRDRTVAHAVPELAAPLRAALAGLEGRFRGVAVEDKKRAVTVHWRNAPEAGPGLLPEIERLIGAAGDDGLFVRRAKMAWEIGRAGVGKSFAVEAFMRAPPFLGRRPIFVGDDHVDLDGIAAAERLGGAGLLVGSPDGPFPDAAAVRRWLRAIAFGEAEATA